MKYELSYHASKRWDERFFDNDLEEELEKSLPFGGQYGNDIMLLSPCEAVFVIRENTVVTILNKHQAISNIQTFLPSWKKALVNKSESTEKLPDDQKILSANSIKFNDQVKALIKQHGIEIAIGQMSDKDKERRAKEIQAFGIGRNNKEYKYRLGEAVFDAARIRREANKEILELEAKVKEQAKKESRIRKRIRKRERRLEKQKKQSNSRCH